MIEQNHIYNNQSADNTTNNNNKSKQKRNITVDSINTKSELKKNDDDSNIDSLPTPSLCIPKRQSRSQIGINQVNSPDRRTLSIVSNNKQTLFNQITNTINTKIDNHPTILSINKYNNAQQRMESLNTRSYSDYENKRHISAPIIYRKISNTLLSTSDSSDDADSRDSFKIYNSTSHFSPTNEMNHNLALVNKQYLDFVENQNQIADSNITIFDLLNERGNHIYLKQKIIGSGNFSDVYQFKRLMDGNFFACKYIKYPIDLLKSLKRDKTKAQEMLLKLESSLLREIKILQEINRLRAEDFSERPNGSQNIIQLVGVNNISILEKSSFIQDYLRENSKLPECYIMTDLCSGGTLLHLVKSCKISIQMIQEIFFQTLLALKFLHQNNIIHRDIKLENLLLTLKSNEILSYFENNIPIPKTLVKISDFGLSKQVTADEPLSNTRCGSPDYIPPEILLGLEYDGKLTDMWSFGVSIYTVLEDMLPFDSQAVLEREKEIALMNGKMVVQKRRGMSDSGRISRCDWKWYYMAALRDDMLDEERVLYEQSKKVVQKCLVRRTERFNAEQILEMDFFKNMY